MGRKRKYIADSLSFGNLCCGLLSIYFASRGRLDFALSFVLLGALLDGLDGLAARAFGGTRFGVIADDLADGVTYGVAPGAALFFVLGGAEGAILGALYTIFTISRLVYFTLNKNGADPNYFAGVPSPTGGVLVMSTLVCLQGQEALIGFLVGVACVLMVSFDTAYRHLGRAFLYRRQMLVYSMPFYLTVLLAGGYYFGLRIVAASILAANLIYGLLPIVIHFKESITERRLRRRGALSDSDEEGVLDSEDDSSEDESEGDVRGEPTAPSRERTG